MSLPPPGIRNNNPFNLVTGVKWRGLSEKQEGGRFCQFDDAVMGIRAGMINFLNMPELHDARTVRQMVTRHAPPVENDTEAYIKAVCHACDLAPDDIVTFTPELGDKWAKSIIQHENGCQPYAQEVISQAIAQAGITA